MKRVVFNFFVLQLVIWSIVFYEGSGEVNEVNQASISDTWEVVKVEDQSAESVVLHYPTFQKLTLNENGSYTRENKDKEIENGSWYLNSERTKLTLTSKGSTKEYDIIQLPVNSAQSFIIKENVNQSTASMDLEYELTRM
jgi:hypothetical protein